MTGEQRRRVLIRMQRPLPLEDHVVPVGCAIRSYDPGRDHGTIRELYGLAFQDQLWPSDWDTFEAFDPEGLFVAEVQAQAVGFAIAFPRGDRGYISVVAVAPGHRRRGIASALVERCGRYLVDLGLASVRIDAYADSPPAVLCYQQLGFVEYERELDVIEPY